MSSSSNRLRNLSSRTLYLITQIQGCLTQVPSNYILTSMEGCTNYQQRVPRSEDLGTPGGQRTSRERHESSCRGTKLWLGSCGLSFQLEDGCDCPGPLNMDNHMESQKFRFSLTACSSSLPAKNHGSLHSDLPWTLRPAPTNKIKA